MKKQQKKSKKNIRRLVMNLVMTCVLVGGLGAILYPFVYDSLNTILDQQIINYYQKKAVAKDQQQTAAAEAKMKAHNAELAKKKKAVGQDPFEKKNQDKKVKKTTEYFKSHTIASLSIPKIKVKLPVYDETSEILLSKGATLLGGTGYPVGGKSTHSVISAHRGLPSARLFTDLPKLKKGDNFYIHINKKIHAYQVDQIKVIEPTDTSQLQIVPGQDLITLMTCTPYMINSHRLLVRGHRVPYVPAKMAKSIEVNSHYQWWRSIIFITLAVSLGVGLIFLIIYWIRRWQISNRQYDLHLECRRGNQPFAQQQLTLFTANSKHKVQRDGQPVTMTTDENGRVTFAQLKGGRYQLHSEDGQLTVKLFVKKVKHQYFSLKVKKPLQLNPDDVIQLPEN